jgi:uncharacterized membrane protein
MAVGERAIPPEICSGKEGSDDTCVEESVEINRPLQEVFDYAANPENLPEGSGIVQEV